MSLETFSKRRVEAQGKEDYYTRRSVVQDIFNKTVLPLLDSHNVDCFIDFSAGDGYLLSLIKSVRLNVTCVGIEKYPPNQGLMCPVIQDDFLNTSREGIRELDGHFRVMMGFNPPFGSNGTLAKKFIEHAVAAFKPCVVVVILPWSAAKRDYMGLVKVSEIKMPRDAYYRPTSGVHFHHASYLCVFESTNNKTLGEPTRASLLLPSWIRHLKDYTQGDPLPKKGLFIRRVGNNCGKNGHFKDDGEFREFRLGQFTGHVLFDVPVLSNRVYFLLSLDNQVTEECIQLFLTRLLHYRNENRDKWTLTRKELIDCANDHTPSESHLPSE